MKSLAADNLIVFVTFTCDQDHVSTSSLADGRLDRLTTIRNDLVPNPPRIERFQYPRLHLLKNRHAIFGTRVIRCQDHHVASLSSHPTHFGSFSTVTITSASEHRNDPAGL